MSSFRSQYYKRTEVEYRGVVQNQWRWHWKEAVTTAFSRLDLNVGRPPLLPIAPFRLERSNIHR
jgi:hypothetical protein